MVHGFAKGRAFDSEAAISFGGTECVFRPEQFEKDRGLEASCHELGTMNWELGTLLPLLSAGR